jgi:hypothetical protein
VCPAGSRRPGPRVLERRPVAPAPVPALRYRVRRAVATVVLALVAVAVVVGLGLIADAVSAARTAEPSGVGVTADSLTPGGEWSGQVLPVPAG